MIKKILFPFLFICLFHNNINSQNIYDAVNYSLSDFQGTARYNSMSGSFGALGGDLTAISTNPAGSAVFNNGHFSISFGSDKKLNHANLLNASNNYEKNNLTLNQIGGVVTFDNLDKEKKLTKISFGITYNQTKNNFNEYRLTGISNSSSIDNYFLNNANGLRLDQISAFDDESITEAYIDIGNVYGYTHQQAFLGYESFIIDPFEFDGENTSYYSNIPQGEFNQNFSYVSRGYNGKLTFNLGLEYGENISFGLNLNSHFIDYDNYTIFDETNNNGESGNFRVNRVYFENRLSTFGEGFSAQFGMIAKVNEILRLGLTYDTPTWYEISEQTSQYLETNITNNLDEESLLITNPNAINIYEDYNFKTPSKLSTSIALVFKGYGLVSFDYSREDFSSLEFKPKNDSFFAALNQEIAFNLKDVNTLRFGAEYLIDRISLRGGFMSKSSPYKTSYITNQNYTIEDTKGFSMGIGYKLKGTTLDLSYVKISNQNFRNLFDTGLTNQINIDTDNSLITLSVSTIF